MITEKELREQLEQCYGVADKEFIGEDINALLMDADCNGGMNVYWNNIPPKLLINGRVFKE